MKPLCILIFCCLTSLSYSQIDVAILGVSHFDNPKLDQQNIRINGLLSPKRQAEMDQLCELLDLYQPTKIVVEVRPDKKYMIEKLYSDYLKGKYQLEESEVEQIGFRLAAKRELAAHDIIGFDYKLYLPFGSLDKTAKQFHQEEYLNRYDSLSQLRNNAKELYLEKHTLTEYLSHINSKERLQANHSYYVDVAAAIGKSENHMGAFFTGLWYQRNICMYSNLLYKVRSKELKQSDRILIIVGNGHKPILSQLFTDSSLFNYVDVKEYLDCRISQR